MSTQSDFDAKVAFVKSWTYGGSKVTNAEKLACYGLFKQVTVGDNTTPQPWAVQLEARAKWDAWNANKGMSKEDAMKAYIANVTKGDPDWEKSDVMSSFKEMKTPF